MARELQNSIHKATVEKGVLTLLNKSTGIKVNIKMEPNKREELLDVIFNRD